MGVNISGKGVLSGLASLVAGVVNNLNLLVTRLIGYTNTGGGGTSYYTTMVGSSGPGFLSFSNTKISYSRDGITWSLGSTLNAGTTWTNPVFGNDKFVNITQFGQTAYSLDGINWSLGTNFGSGIYNQITFANNIFTTISYDGQVVYSLDGITWSLGNQISGNWYNNPVFGNNIFVNRSSLGQAAYSLDGINWSLGNQISGNWIASLSFNNNIFTDISSNGKAVYSLDGINWSLGTDLTNLGTDFIYGATFGNNVFVMSSSMGQIIYSLDGINWSLAGETGVSNNIRIAFGNNIFVGITLLGNTLASTDGINWALLSDLSGTWFNPTIFANNVFLNINTDGEVAYSLNGVAWNQVNLGPGSNFPGISFGTVSTLVETQIVIGDSGSGGAEILAPVDVYTVPAGKTTSIDEIRIKNNSLNQITYDLGVLSSGVNLSDQNALINDQVVSAGATSTLTNIVGTMSAGQRLVVFPSAVDVVEVKVYGTESNI